MGGQPSKPQPRQTLDYERYSGTWYEIAKFPFAWEQKCPHATAHYSFEKNVLQVRNDCLDENKNVVYSRFAEARPVTPGSSHLRIQFKGLPNDGEGDYWVEATDYEYAIVGNREKSLLWILYRKPHMTSCFFEKVVHLAAALGYNTTKIKTNQGAIMKCK